MTNVLAHHTHMRIEGHLLIDGFTECVEEKRACHSVTDIPAMPASAAKLSQPVLDQPPAAKVVSNNTESNNPGESKSTRSPRSWGVIQSTPGTVQTGQWANPRHHLPAHL